MFRSQTITVHLIRGVIGIAALTGSMVWVHTNAPLATAALITALVSLRGCPTCWSVGLIETIAYSRRRSIDSACLGGCGAPTAGARDEPAAVRPSERPAR